MNMKESIIIAVKNRPALWDRKHRNHHNRHFLIREWKAVAAELNVPGRDKFVKIAWKNLRQEFYKQLNKSTRSGDESSWQFFNDLLFLKDQFLPRRSIENLSPLPDDAYTEVNEPMDSLLEVDSSSEINDATMDSTMSPDVSDNSLPVEEYTRTGFKRRITTQARIGQELVNLEKEKLELKINKIDGINKNDEDVGFFNSLLPHVKTLGPRKKMMFRMKVQELLFDMAYSAEHESSYNNHPTSSAMSHRSSITTILM
ncbi:transcription factor Adf-1-like isoform X2 [Nilaparvata lugens]|uniref:transcription factor Adf-1-like isoform X2 n=1 Tax=Nilaparvata lugens TaxID=108931 RepID=UPI00193EB8F8|nr:transcription factor Adf-1-like isoform X2 [Nilaparvata lugens]